MYRVYRSYRDGNHLEVRLRAASQKRAATIFSAHSHLLINFH